jgi:hypothetical protein
MVKMLEGKEGSAVFSDDELYRYELRPKPWSDGWLFGIMMLNPSVASHEVKDPTITRVIGFAKREGAGGLVVVNANAWRATDPDELLTAADPIGPENDRYVLGAVEAAKVFVVAWGAMAKPIRLKTWRIRRMIFSTRSDLLCLGKTTGGDPRHPLYIRADQPLIPFTPPGA